MAASRPYSEKIRNVAAHLSFAQSESKHPFLITREKIKNVGLIVVTSDKGLCGGLNTNVLRTSLNQIKDWEKEGKKVHIAAIGTKGFSFMKRIGADVKSNITGLGDTPHVNDLIGSIKVMLDEYINGEIDQLYICYTKFINTMKQEPMMDQVLPLSGEKIGAPEGPWDYIYEPNVDAVIDELLKRYIESIIYHSVAENMASEQSARMVAMKAASDNAVNVIDELTLVYNKARQAAITKEISEIVGGAAAVS
jgi:F-type H+-transporting ATPase subunit gamma